jgi:hypothetical protein
LSDTPTPTEEPAVTEQQPTADEGSAAAATEPPTYQPTAEQGEWLDDSVQLPRRPRRRVLTPLPLALLAVLAIACGFIAGVLVEKGQGGSGAASGGGGAAARFAALRAGSSKAATPAAGGSSGGASGGRSSGAAGSGAGAGATSGQVAYVSGSTLYVTTTEGNTVKVTTSPRSTVTKTVKASVKGIHPGETVVVAGKAGASGAISAESIRVGTAGAGGLAGLFGGSRSGSPSAQGGSSSTSSEPALFGSGG